MGLAYNDLGGEENEHLYVDSFRSLYPTNITLPEGHLIEIRRDEKSVKHFWRGTDGVFKIRRATRIGLIEDVLNDSTFRKCYHDPIFNKFYFFSKKISNKLQCYLVICSYDNYTNIYYLDTAYPVDAKYVANKIKNNKLVLYSTALTTN